MNLQEAAADLGSLRQNLTEERGEICERSLQKGLEIAQQWDIATERRVRRRRMMPGEDARDAGLTMKEELNRVIKLAIDTLAQEIDDRSERLRDLNSCFGFLLDINSLLSSDHEPEDLFHQCADFGLEYEGDVNGTSLYEEILDCRMLFKRRQQSALLLPSSAEELLKATIQYGKDVFPNLRTALQILLTISVSVASCERSFSKLKLIKTHLRSTMTQERLTDLAILSIEKTTFELINFDDIIDQFAERKARKINMHA
jgi:hypothetical protein